MSYKCKLCGHEFRIERDIRYHIILEHNIFSKQLGQYYYKIHKKIKNNKIYKL